MPELDLDPNTVFWTLVILAIIIVTLEEYPIRMGKKQKKPRASQGGKENTPKDFNSENKYDGGYTTVSIAPTQNLAMRPSERNVNGKDDQQPQLPAIIEPLDHNGEVAEMYDGSNGRPNTPYDKGYDEPMDVNENSNENSITANFSSDDIEKEKTKDTTDAKFPIDETNDNGAIGYEHIENVATDLEPVDEATTDAKSIDKSNNNAISYGIGIDSDGNKYPIFPDHLRKIQEENTANYEAEFLALQKKYIHPTTLFDTAEKLGKNRSEKYPSYLDLEVRRAIHLAARNVYHLHIRSDEERADFDNECVLLHKKYYGKKEALPCGMRRLAKAFNKDLRIGTKASASDGTASDGTAGGENDDGNGNGNGSGSGVNNTDSKDVCNSSITDSINKGKDTEKNAGDRINNVNNQTNDKPPKHTADN